MRDHAGTLSFAPRLPGGMTGLSFTVVRRKLRLLVAVSAGKASYRLLDAAGALAITHYAETVTLEGSTAVECAIPRPPAPSFSTRCGLCSRVADVSRQTAYGFWCRAGGWPCCEV